MESEQKKPGALSERGQGTRPGRRRVLGIAAYLLFLLTLAGGIEGVARIIGARSGNPAIRLMLYDYGLLAQGDVSRFRFVPDAELPYRLKPGFEFRSPDGLQVTRHNSAGFRADAEFGPKDEATLRVICLGGSTTYGVSVVDNRATYPAVLEQLLNGDFKADGWARVEVFNLGVGGYTSREVLKNLELHGMPLDPDVVLVQCAINDVLPRLYPNFAMDYSHFRKPLEPLEPGLFARWAYHSQLVVLTGYELGMIEPLTLQSRSQYPMPPAATALENLTRNDTQAYRRNLSGIIACAQEANAQIWLLTQAHLFGQGGKAPTEEMQMMDEAYRLGAVEHDQVVRDLAADAGVGLVDLERTMPSSRQYFTDEIHMSEAGNLVKARLVAASIRTGLPIRKP